MEDLPFEILLNIVNNLSLTDIKQLRLASHSLLEVAGHGFFRKYHVNLHETSVSRLQDLGQDSVRKHLVKTLIVDIRTVERLATLPKFKTAIFPYGKISRPTYADLYNDYKMYLCEQRLSHAETITRLLLDLPDLQTLQIITGRGLPRNPLLSQFRALAHGPRIDKSHVYHFAQHWADSRTHNSDLPRVEAFFRAIIDLSSNDAAPLKRLIMQPICSNFLEVKFPATSKITALQLGLDPHLPSPQNSNLLGSFAARFRQLEELTVDFDVRIIARNDELSGRSPLAWGGRCAALASELFCSDLSASPHLKRLELRNIACTAQALSAILRSTASSLRDLTLSHIHLCSGSWLTVFRKMAKHFELEDLTLSGALSSTFEHWSPRPDLTQSQCQHSSPPKNVYQRLVCYITSKGTTSMPLLPGYVPRCSTHHKPSRKQWDWYSLATIANQYMQDHSFNFDASKSQKVTPYVSDECPQECQNYSDAPDYDEDMTLSQILGLPDDFVTRLENSHSYWDVYAHLCEQNEMAAKKALVWLDLFGQNEAVLATKRVYEKSEDVSDPTARAKDRNDHENNTYKREGSPLLAITIDDDDTMMEDIETDYFINDTGPMPFRHNPRQLGFDRATGCCAPSSTLLRCNRNESTEQLSLQNALSASSSSFQVRPVETQPIRNGVMTVGLPHLSCALNDAQFVQLYRNSGAASTTDTSSAVSAGLINAQYDSNGQVGRLLSLI